MAALTTDQTLEQETLSSKLRLLRAEISQARRELEAGVAQDADLTCRRNLVLSERVDRLIVAYMRHLQSEG